MNTPTKKTIQKQSVTPPKFNGGVSLTVRLIGIGQNEKWITVNEVKGNTRKIFGTKEHIQTMVINHCYNIQIRSRNNDQVEIASVPD